ncbi:MAG: hypothetical protein O7D94_05565 [Planctomycetota bacterium]|nr:hypothetical protein [Planctomycetota bacterium]
MLTQTTLITIAIFLGGPVTQAQDEEDAPRRFERGGQRDSENDGERQERRRQWRERMQQYRSATPEERRQLRLDRYVGMTTRMYDLDDTQKSVVRSEINAMAEERRTNMGPDAEEYDRLRDQMTQFWSSDRGNDTGDRGSRWREMRNDPKFREMRERMREFESKYPFDWQASVSRIEKLLPEEQVKEGRKKWQDRRGWRDRRGRERRNRADRTDDVKLLRDRADLVEQAKRAGRAGDAKRLKGEADGRAAGPGQRDTPNDGKPKDSRPPPRPLHPWVKYTQAFGERHDLSQTQAASAESILKDVLSRAGQIESGNAARIAKAERVLDAAVREKRLAELRRPIDQLFDELKKRLDDVLTAAQRSKSK